MDLIVITVIKILVIFGVSSGLASLCVWIERKGSALIQDRIGANRAGAFFYSSNPFFNLLLFPVRVFGMLGVINTLFCDFVKAIFKEDFVPEGASNFIHSLAPFLAAFPVFVAFAVIPIAPDFTIFGHSIRAQVASLNVGVLFFLAMGSIAVYGATLAGWCGRNKYSLLGGLRTAAQMISYELPLGVAVVTMIVIYGTLDLYEIVDKQSGLLFGVLPAWGVFMQPLAFLLFFVAGMAETKRAPFDLPESESELVAGYMTEYSGMKFLMFWLGEFTEIALLSVLIVLFFFGGWHLNFYSYSDQWWMALIGHGVFMAKVVFFCTLQIVIRWTLPRFRYDQLMNLGWKMLLPVGIVNLMATAAWMLLK